MTSRSWTRKACAPGAKFCRVAGTASFFRRRGERVISLNPYAAIYPLGGSAEDRAAPRSTNVGPPPHLASSGWHAGLAGATSGPPRSTEWTALGASLLVLPSARAATPQRAAPRRPAAGASACRAVQARPRAALTLRLSEDYPARTAGLWTEGSRGRRHYIRSGRIFRPVTDGHHLPRNCQETLYLTPRNHSLAR